MRKVLEYLPHSWRINVRKTGKEDFRSFFSLSKLKVLWSLYCRFFACSQQKRLKNCRILWIFMDFLLLASRMYFCTKTRHSRSLYAFVSFSNNFCCYIALWIFVEGFFLVKKSYTDERINLFANATGTFFHYSHNTDLKRL